MARSMKTDTPTPAAVRAARLAAGQTQAQAAACVHIYVRTWQRYEAGSTPIPAAVWELYRVKAALATAQKSDERRLTDTSK